MAPGTFHKSNIYFSVKYESERKRRRTGEGNHQGEEKEGNWCVLFFFLVSFTGIFDPNLKKKRNELLFQSSCHKKKKPVLTSFSLSQKPSPPQQPASGDSQYP